MKAQRYAALGVEHHWIVDPELRRVECFRRSGAEFHARIEGQGAARIEHPDWKELVIDLAALWDQGEPSRLSRSGL